MGRRLMGTSAVVERHHLRTIARGLLAKNHQATAYICTLCEMMRPVGEYPDDSAAYADFKHAFGCVVPAARAVLAEEPAWQTFAVVG